jgi:sensor domain CHASE-containing protein/HPt (histidine-containing phosphotransfer) domain-containing protein
MKLAPKTLIVVVTVVLGMAVGTDALVSRLVVRQLLEVEERETTERARVAAGVIDEQADEFRLLSQDWAVWSEMVDFARAPTTEFTDENMTLDTFQLKQWQTMAIVRSADKGTAWAGALVPPDKLGPASAGFLALARRLTLPPDEEAPRQGFVADDGSLFIVASQPLRMADGRPGTTRGAMVYARKLDDAWAKRVREVTRLDLRVVPLSSAESPREAALLSALSSGDALLEPRDDETLVTHTLLRDIDGAPLAFVTINHPRPHFAAAREMQRALSIGIALGAGLLGLLAYALVHFGLLRRIHDLAKFVVAIKNGAADSSAPIAPASRSRDELTRLGRRVQHLAHVLAEREGNLRIAEDLARAVLDGVDEALVLCDASGEIVSEVSAPAVAWFGDPKDAASGKVWSYLGDEREGWRLELGLEQLTAGFLPIELALAQLPTSIQREGDTYFLRYHPLLSGEDVTGLLIVIQHATEQVALAKSEAIATELCQVLRHAIDEPQEFRAFVREAEAWLLDVDRTHDAAVRLRAIHTLKGNAACFGMRSVAEAAHWLEDRLAEEPDSHVAHAGHLRAAWEVAMTRVRAEIDLDDDSLTVPAAEYEAILTLIARVRRPSLRPSVAPSGAPCA